MSALPTAETVGEGFAFRVWIYLKRRDYPLSPLGNAFALFAWSRGDR